MADLFSSLTHAVEGAPLLALGAALAWGVLSILLSPCHLASIPLIVGLIDAQEDRSTRRALLTSILFATGILLTIGLIGVVTATAGRMLGQVGPVGNYVVAVIFLIVGLNLLGVIPLGWRTPDAAGSGRKGLCAAFMLGLVFGIALGPCSFAYLAPMLGIAFKLGAERPVYAGGLLLMYGLGHCGVIAVAGVSAGLVQKYRSWNLRSHGALRLKRACGALVVLFGLYLIYKA